jgi:16S rRNA (uracil1498-N3)-methyltransferase
MLINQIHRIAVGTIIIIAADCPVITASSINTMSLPLFYIEQLEQEKIQLDEDTSKHVIQVLRMKKGEELMLTNGTGKRVRAAIDDDNRKRCVVRAVSSEQVERNTRKVTIGISPVKHHARFEWFLEKATEIGVSAIIPLICQRTEKQAFRYDRMKNILVSAMLQSQQSWLPVLHQATDFKNAVTHLPAASKLIAHCLPEEKKSLTVFRDLQDSMILIGPEGDFTPSEISLALQNGFLAVTLGETRLRTETAGMVAAALMVVG